jgi:opacity protein-like surface antigen
MKKILLLLALFVATIGFTQNDDFFDFGAVGGLNFGSNGDLSNDFSGQNLKSDNKSGYHVGVYFNFKIKNSYIRPEVLYTKTKSEFSSDDYDVTKIDVPLLYGIDVVGPLSIFFGPSFQYTLDTELENVETDAIDIKNDIAINGQFGIALKLGKQIRLDARYEIGLSDNISEISEISPINATSEIDNKPNQLIFSISLQL